jgi:two-component system, NarL family, response regulator LiaR
LLPINRDTTVLGDKARKSRILLADSHHMVREGIRKLIESEPDLEVVGEADNAVDACKLAFDLKPNVVVMDGRLPRINPEIAIKKSTNIESSRFVLILTSFEDEEHALGLLKAGANGCIFNTATGDDLIQAIRTIRSGQFVCDPAIEKSLLSYFNKGTPMASGNGEHISPRETEVLELAAKGCSNREIAVHLDLTEGTIKSYLEHIFNKLNVRSRTEAVLEGLKRGLVRLNEVKGSE